MGQCGGSEESNHEGEGGDQEWAAAIGGELEPAEDLAKDEEPVFAQRGKKGSRRGKQKGRGR